MESTVTSDSQPPEPTAAEEARRDSIAEELRAAIRRKLTPKSERPADGAR